MSPDRLRECLEVLGWSQRGLARMLGINEATVRQWAAGRVLMPLRISTWLETLARFAERNPPPVRA